MNVIIFSIFLKYKLYVAIAMLLLFLFSNSNGVIFHIFLGIATFFIPIWQ